MKHFAGVVADEEEEEASQELAPQGRRERSTEAARNCSCCWAHWSSVDGAVAADEAAAAAAVEAAAVAVPSCASGVLLALADAS